MPNYRKTLLNYNHRLGHYSDLDFLKILLDYPDMLTLRAPGILEGCIKIKINLNFSFYNSL